MFNKDGEYYRKFTEKGQCPGLFAKFLETHSICAQYTMFGTPKQNNVAERHNYTLMFSFSSFNLIIVDGSFKDGYVPIKYGS